MPKDTISKNASGDNYLKVELENLIVSDISIFRFIQEGSLDGIWYWDLESPENEWMSDAFWRLLGCDPEKREDLASEWKDLIHPDDLLIAESNCRLHLEDPSHAYDQVVRYFHQDGSTVWVRCRGIAIRDETGKPLRMLGAHTDLTLVKKTEQSLREKTIELENANQLLEDSRREVEAASQAKSEFLARMSHELRTPLNAILGFGHLQKRAFDKDTVPKLVTCQQQIEDAGSHLLALVDDILNVVKIEDRAAKLIENMQAVSVDLAMEKSLIIAGSNAEIKNISLSSEPSHLFVRASFEQLVRVLVHLVTNAIKFNNIDGRVHISAKCTEAGVKINVNDTGVGIDETESIDIFQPFARLRYASLQEIAGVGLGLALGKYWTMEMGGSIGYSSVQSKGSDFWVCLPEASELQMSTKNKILYIEDDKNNRELFRLLVSPEEDIELHIAEHAEEGIKMASEYIPDLVLIDINLPRMGGIELVKFLRKDDKFKSTRFVALSAEATPSVIDEALASGFDKYYTKPFDIDEVLDECLKK